MKALFKRTNPDQPLGGRYKIIGELGAGGFGQTFLAQDLHLPDHPQCVVKQLKPQVSDAESFQTATRLFDVEARVLYQLGNHDQIPRLLAHFEENQEFYLAQELIDGEPLTQEMKGGQPWSETQVIAFLQDLLPILTFVHEQNVIHRDLKPSNLMRRRQDGKIVLIDFGAVKQVSTQIVNPQTGQTRTISIGTQGYTPKEQLGGNPRFSSDIYSAGIIAIQMLTGIHPRNLAEDDQTGEISWRDRAPHVSAELAEFLDRMVRYDFRARYPTAAEALVALRNLSTSRTQFGPISPPFSEDLGELPTQKRQSSANSHESTGSGLGQAPTNPFPPPQTMESTGSGYEQSATNFLAPSAASSHSQTPSTHTDPTVPVGKFPCPEHSSVSAVPTAVAPQKGGQRRLLIPLSILAVLGTVGATFLMTKTFLSPQFANQTIDRREVPGVSSNPSSGESSVSPTEASSPTASPSETPDETPASPTVASSPTASSEATASPTSTAPSPTASPVATPTSPTPSAAPSAPKSAPASVPTTVKSAPSPAAPQVGEFVKQADRAREAGQFQKAIELYDQAIALNPKLAEAHWGRCYSLNSVQQPDDAIAACNQALAINPNYPEALWSKGSALDQKQRFNESLKLYQQATAVKPNFAEAWNNQGVSLLALDRITEAVTAFDKATALKPGFANAWGNRGAALWKLGRFDDAIVSMDKALQIQPNNPDIINLRQQAREKLGR
ncbi:protein kinase domain-containing protein [Allocoleopsis franciscana]|uniref:non-specific serine/threonine protein kinase n=1 Tax=Allocoleopsis franciscana PCC 7113 TaxID=1173027 RepID=K9W9Z7_9CYAN|nr:serine/threonine-protein kinase [Allocoleopsis franciscana]AFZ16631.1 serine/threonine protein kinase [Allocoleopsis franciscana PCC 7113]